MAAGLLCFMHFFWPEAFFRKVFLYQKEGVAEKLCLGNTCPDRPLQQE